MQFITFRHALSAIMGATLQLLSLILDARALRFSYQRLYQAP